MYIDYQMFVAKIKQTIKNPPEGYDFMLFFKDGRSEGNPNLVSVSRLVIFCRQILFTLSYESISIILVTVIGDISQDKTNFRGLVGAKGNLAASLRHDDIFLCLICSLILHFKSSVIMMPCNFRWILIGCHEMMTLKAIPTISLAAGVRLNGICYCS